MNILAVTVEVPVEVPPPAHVEEPPPMEPPVHVPGVVVVPHSPSTGAGNPDGLLVALALVFLVFVLTLVAIGVWAGREK